MLIKTKSGGILMDTGKSVLDTNELKDKLFLNNAFSIHNYPMFSRITNGIRYSLLKEQDAKNVKQLIERGYLSRTQREYGDSILDFAEKYAKHDKSIKNDIKQLESIYNVRKWKYHSDF